MAPQNASAGVTEDQSPKGTFSFIGQCRTLQMQHSVFDFLRPTLVPELGSDIAAGTSCYEQLILVAVATVRAFPDQLAGIVSDDLDLAVIAAHLAVVALRIKLCIYDIIVYELHATLKCRSACSYPNF